MARAVAAAHSASLHRAPGGAEVLVIRLDALRSGPRLRFHRPVPSLPWYHSHIVTAFGMDCD